MKKGILKRFSLVIYPVSFVVAIGDVEKEINEQFKPYGDDGYLVFSEGNYLAFTYRVEDKETSEIYSMVWFKDASCFTASNVAHECVHSALDIYDYIGAEADTKNQEPFAYLVGNLARLASGTFKELKDSKKK